jgi:hypothetical protein
VVYPDLRARAAVCGAGGVARGDGIFCELFHRKFRIRQGVCSRATRKHRFRGIKHGRDPRAYDFQPLVGVTLDRYWQGAMLNGKRVFDLASYQIGFSAVLLWGAISLLLLLSTKETFCKQTP